MYSSAPSLRASSRLLFLRLIATTLSAPRALAKRTPKWPRPPGCVSPQYCGILDDAYRFRWCRPSCRAHSHWAWVASRLLCLRLSGTLALEPDFGGFSCDWLTQHGSRLLARNLVRDLDHKVWVASVIVGVSSVGVRAVWEFGSIGSNHALAMVLDSGSTLFTIRLEAGCILSSNAHAVTDFDAFLDLWSNADGLANNLVADAARVRSWTCLESQRHISFAGLWHVPHPDRRVCKSEPQMPQCVIWISTSVSSKGFTLGNSRHTILPSALSGDSPIHPWNL